VEITDDMGLKTSRMIIDEERELSLSSCEGKFFRFHDKISKRRNLLENLNESHLSLWSKRQACDVELTIYPYGFDIDNKTFKQLTERDNETDTDRAGAIKE